MIQILGRLPLGKLGPGVLLLASAVSGLPASLQAKPPNIV